MKLAPFLILFMAGFLCYSCQKEDVTPELNLPSGQTFLSQTINKSAKDIKEICKREFEIQCLGGEKFVVRIGEIAEPLDTEAYCQKKLAEGKLASKCSLEECVDRLDVLFNFRAASPKGNGCVSQNWNSK